MKSSNWRLHWRKVAGPVALVPNPKGVEIHRPKNTIAGPTEVVVVVVAVVLEVAAGVGSPGSSNGNSTRSPPSQRLSSEQPIDCPCRPLLRGQTLGR